MEFKCCLTGANDEPEKILPCPSVNTCSDTVSSFDIPKVKPNKCLWELITPIVKIIRKKRNEIERAFKVIDTQDTGKILKSEMKQLLRIHCFPLTVEQFDCFLKYCTEDEVGNIYYKELLSRLSGCPNVTESVLSVLPCRISVDELEARLKPKIYKHLKNIARGFITYDYAKDGYIQKFEFRRVLENYCFKMTNDQFDCLWKRHDLINLGMIQYQDFLINIGVYTEVCQKYGTSNHLRKAILKPKDVQAKEIIESKRMPIIESIDDPAIKTMNIDQIADRFIKRLQIEGMMMMLTNACQKHDRINTGLMYAEDFHAVLNEYVMPMSRGMFIQLMQHCFTPSCVSQVYSYKEFINKFCHPTKHIDPDFVDHPFCLPNTPFPKRVKSTLRRIERSVCDAKNRLAASFITMNHRGAVIFTRWELRRALEHMNIYLPEENLRDLFTFLDPMNTNMITIQNFMDVFEHQAEKPYMKEEYMLTTRGQGYPNLRREPLKRKFRYFFNRYFGDIQRDVFNVDVKKTFKIHQNTLRHIIEKYCFYFTDEQWEEMLKDFQLLNDHVYYNMFFDCHRKTCAEDKDKWVKDVCKLMNQKHKKLLFLEHREVVRHVKDYVRSKGANLLRDFLGRDMGGRTGNISKCDFRKILSKHVLRLNQPQFENLWLEVPKNSEGKLVYSMFLQRFGFI